MGSCWSGFLAELQKIRRPLDYYQSHQARAARYNVRDRGDGIEFDNLLSEDEYEIQTKPRQKVVTDEECTFVNQKRYGDLVEKQKVINEQIDHKLQQHEDELRQQEEEFYAAKREASRVARQEKSRIEKGKGKTVAKNKTDENLTKILDDSAFASWLSDEDEDDDHDLDTEDFEQFLQKIRQTTYPGAPAESADGESSKSNEAFEESLAGDVEATKLAEKSLDALDRWSPTFDDD